MPTSPSLTTLLVTIGFVSLAVTTLIPLAIVIAMCIGCGSIDILHRGINPMVLLRKAYSSNNNDLDHL
jgi:hypothetical protein